MRPAVDLARAAEAGGEPDHDTLLDRDVSGDELAREDIEPAHIAQDEIARLLTLCCAEATAKRVGDRHERIIARPASRCGRAARPSWACRYFAKVCLQYASSPPLIGGSGSSGGTRRGGAWKSKKSIGTSAFASRAVSAGRRCFAWMKRRMLV